MDLRTKILIAVAATLVFVLIVFVLSASTVMQGSYAEIETRQMQKDVGLVTSDITYELDDLDSLVQDRAPRDDTWQFIQDMDEDYVRNNLDHDTLVNLKIDTAVFLNRSGALVYGTHLDQTTGRTGAVNPDELMKIQALQTLFSNAERDTSFKGFVGLPSGPAFISSHPVLKSDFSGPSPGSLIVVRYLDSQEIEMLSHRTGLVISLLNPDSFRPGDEYSMVTAGLSQDSPVLVTPFNGNLSTGYALFSDIQGGKLFIIRVDAPPSIFFSGLKAMYTFLVIVFIIGLGLGLLGLFLLDTVILTRLNDIIRGVRQVGSGEGPRRIGEISGHDELAQLAVAINIMLDEIDKSHRMIMESERRYRMVVEDQTELVCRFGGNGVLNFANLSFRRFFPDFCHQDPFPVIFDVVPQQYRDSIKDFIGRLDLNQPVGNSEYPFESEGRKGWISWTARAIYGTDEIFQEYQLVGRDITATKEATLELQRYRDHLQEIVKQRTSELMNAREELQKAERLEAIGLLAGGIAHDFNNFLTMILGNIEILKDQTADYPELATRVRNLELATIQAGALTRQMLTFAKGGGPIKKKSDLSELVKNVSMHVCKGSGTTCKVRCAPDLPPVDVDPQQIEQVITNILVNARQAMPQGGTIQIEVVPEQVDKDISIPLPDGMYVKIAVTDSGHGIPKEDLYKIFNPFYTTKPPSEGLGLAISLSIVRKHGGYITVTSDVGKGSTFNVYLPVMKVSVKPGHGHLKRRFDQTMADRTPRVLLMDDEEGIRDVLTQMLATRGIGVIATSSGEEAIEVYKKALGEGMRFDVVILDLTVPEGMGGKETMERLLGIDPGVKAIVASGYFNDPIMSEYTRYGFSGVMPKPFVIKDLYALIQSLIRD